MVQSWLLMQEAEGQSVLQQQGSCMLRVVLQCTQARGGVVQLCLTLMSNSSPPGGKQIAVSSRSTADPSRSSSGQQRSYHCLYVTLLV